MKSVRRGGGRTVRGAARRLTGLTATALAVTAFAVVFTPPAFADTVLLQSGSAMSYRANSTDPGLGMTWTAPGYPDGSWSVGNYGVGYETAPPGATSLLQSTVPPGSFSVYTRARFTVSDASAVTRLLLGADYDDGYVVWINGVEVYRSPSMPAGALAWNTNAALHESSNGLTPNYGTLVDITSLGLPALISGQNVLAVGVWNSGAPGSTDLVLVPRLSIVLGASVTRGPYLQLGTPEGVVVRWRTDAATASRVRYGPDPNNLTFTVDAAGVAAEHVVTVAGLNPATNYFYSVGTPTQTLAGGDAEHYFRTSPPPGTHAPTRIWVIGDSGTADSGARAVRDAYYAFAGGPRADFWLMLGDNAYPDGSDSAYQAAVFDMYPELLRHAVLWPTLGNHDGITADSASETGPYYDLFTLPRNAEAGGLASGTEAYYSFDYGNIHFICLDSYETDRSPSAAMLTWAQQDALSTTQDWVVAFWHHPPYTKGSHNSDTEPELIEMRQNALPILESAGVDLVLTGHSHSYERSYLLDGHYGLSTSLTASMKKDGGDGRTDGTGAYRKPTTGPAPHEGAVYVVAGSSGQTSGGALNHPANLVSLNVLGSLVLDIDGNQLDARFLDNSGTWRDHFTIFKGPGTAPGADFTGDPLAGIQPLTVSFADVSSGGPHAWAWDFDNDGSVDSTSQSPSHQYVTPGLFSVRLTASNALGSGVLTRTDYVCVLSSNGLADVDGDGVSDGIDVCPCLADPSQLDTDQDGLGDACDLDDDGDGAPDATDCEPLNGSVTGPSGEVGESLEVGANPDQISWTQAPQSVVSNLYRGLIDTGASFTYNHACLAARLPVPHSTDQDTPAPGEAFYYLASGANGCGEGGLGSASGGAPRPNPSPCL